MGCHTRGGVWTREGQQDGHLGLDSIGWLYQGDSAVLSPLSTRHFLSQAPHPIIPEVTLLADHEAQLDLKGVRMGNLLGIVSDDYKISFIVHLGYKGSHGFSGSPFFSKT